ncbi:uncharacterized protein LOC124917232 isoform X2 [Impatiens glandulifera]|uniref:uncharacterized protein LOC124917232 isoform X2 n=1 Tax=Impatiens glandulifera TaxID=253017 RepID=UPI001FB07F4C|nr:uncharacterized protein LOC124917232 isoform X2 [Impatiens glandulifera]
MTIQKEPFFYPCLPYYHKEKIPSKLLRSFKTWKNFQFPLCVIELLMLKHWLDYIWSWVRCLSYCLMDGTASMVANVCLQVLDSIRLQHGAEYCSEDLHARSKVIKGLVKLASGDVDSVY